MGAGKRFSAGLEPGGDPGPIVIAALAAAEEFAAQTALAPRDRARLAVVVEELVSNVLRHGAAGGRISLDLTLAIDRDAVALAIEDDGLAFDPTRNRGFAGPDPVTGGGVGLAVVRSWVDEFAYSREEGRNRISLLLRPT